MSRLTNTYLKKYWTGHSVASVTLLAALATGGCEGPQYDLQSQAVASTTTLLRHWAPVHYQDVDKGRFDGKGDMITKFNYDGNWIANDNWDNLLTGRADLSAWVYGQVAETTTQWFLTYSFFHPRDWVEGRSFKIEHENDVESATVIVRKDGSDFGFLEGLMTEQHGFRRYYRAAGSTTITAAPNGTFHTEILAGENHGRPRTFQEAEGHGIYACGDGGTKCDRLDDGIRYVPGDKGAKPPSGQGIGNWTPVTYGLRDLAEIWNKRLPNTGGVDQGQSWSAATIFTNPGALAATLIGNESGGCGSAVTANCETNAASWPWLSIKAADAAITKDPAAFFAKILSFSSGNRPQSNYIKNDFDVTFTGSTPESGFPLAHSSSGLCIHPNGGDLSPANGTRAVLFAQCFNQQRLQFRMLPNGSIQHVSSGKCLHPEGGSNVPDNGTRMVFHDGCDEARLAFEVTEQGSLKHKISGKCVHPAGGSVVPNAQTNLVLWDGCDEPRLRFEGKFTEGRIAHSGNSCIHPEGGSSIPADGTSIVLWDDCRNDPSRVYRFRPDGNIEHVASGMCLHPRGGSANPDNGTFLALFGQCGESRLSFRVTPAGSIQHIPSGKCIHPAGGALSPGNGTGLVLWDGCNMDRIRFAPVTQL